MKKYISKILIGICLISFIFTIPNAVFALNNSKKESQTEIDNPEVFSGYMKRLQIKIKSNWNPPLAESSMQTFVLFKVQRNGKMTSAKVIKSSGNKEMDKAAIEALKKSAPFEPLPADFSGNNVHIQFTFDYKNHKNMENFE